MGKMHIGPKDHINQLKVAPKQPTFLNNQSDSNSVLILNNRISELEHQLSVPNVPLIKYVEVPVEKTIEVTKYVEVPVEVIKYIEVPISKETIVHVPVDVISEKVVEKIITVTPKWVFGVMVFELVIIILAYFK